MHLQSTILYIGTLSLLYIVVVTSAGTIPKKPASTFTLKPAPSSTKPSSGNPSTTSVSSSTSSKKNTSAENGNESMSYDQFCQCISAYSKTSAGGTPPCPDKTVFEAYKTHVGSKLSLKEQAMFLANSIWETGGLRLLKEKDCSNGSCPYGKYFGRGYLQLTWDYNYKKASEAIYHDDSLLSSPDKAAEQPGAWQTAVWYWVTVVQPALAKANAIDTYKLGHSVKAINGNIECSGGPKQAAQNRLAIYNEILKILNIDGTGTLEGCA